MAGSQRLITPLLSKRIRWKRALTAGVSAGLVSGLFAAAIGFIFGELIANKIDPRSYLPSVSPESVKMFLFNQSPLMGSLLLLVLITGSIIGFGGIIIHTTQ